MMKYLQNLGKSLMLPVAVLPAAAVLMGIGHWIDSFFEADSRFAAFLISGGDAILSSLAILFAVGVAIGMTKAKDGAAALSGLVGYLVITKVLESESVASLLQIDLSQVDMAFDNIENVFIGILAGLISAALYNRFNHVSLPDAFAFFSGKRLVPILTAATMLLVSIAVLFVWPVVYGWLVSFGTMISNLGAAGAGLYGFFNRLLIPTGLHHALNNVFWFDVAGINDIGNFWDGNGEPGVTGRYMAGFFPIMMFGLPAAALAMYHTARTKQRKQAASLLMAVGFASFFTGVTEPLEFSFMFLAPVLYFVHAVLTGLSLFIAAAFQWTAGFTFSAGFVDYFLSFRLPLANQPYMLILQGLAFAVVYYFLFRFLIVKLDLKTPGRQDDNELAEEPTTNPESANEAKDKHTLMAETIYTHLGKKENIDSIDNCATRLRLEIQDMDKVNQDGIKKTGVPGVQQVSKNNLQIIVGTQVQAVADALQKLYNEDKS
ncbi:N-acetylglucosamine-specific PTS transporter subunit IIBC [Oceanobacillus oncorhynchi]|uniref:N-acetylglucosamine-specific PTS transporter subunit IIBC n=1 Tax=Oceanobacillus oncorhynchi TaxID=545501 RepID=UPI0018674B05|nr:N-acetylglucosamine-specific PTS transporter subunit IIBC [Oceanobacillus oncorhynchi]